MMTWFTDAYASSGLDELKSSHVVLKFDRRLPNHLSDSWWRHQMETFSALLAICAGNSPVSGEFPSQRPVTRSFYVFFYLRLNERLSKQSWGWWFETPSCSLWRHCNVQSEWGIPNWNLRVRKIARSECKTFYRPVDKHSAITLGQFCEPALKIDSHLPVTWRKSFELYRSW